MRWLFPICLWMICSPVLSQSIVSADTPQLKGVFSCLEIPRRAPASDKPLIRFNCARTLTQSETPLIIIDGIPAEDEAITKLDPNDIASIDVLKESSPSIIYCRRPKPVILITTKKSNFRRFIIKDFLDGSRIAGATVSFISKEKNDTLMFVANDSGVVIADKLKAGKVYEVKVSSAGYKGFTTMINVAGNDKQELLLERDVVGIKEVIVVSYPVVRCYRVTCTISSITRCSLLYKKDNLSFIASFSSLNLYPNPVQKGKAVTVNIDAETGDQLGIRVFNLSGQLLSSQVVKAVKGNNRVTIHTGFAWSTGTYLVQVIDKNGKQLKSGKLIIQ